MLQAAALAQAGATCAVIAAALLHDTGRILADRRAQPHQSTGPCWLTGRFPVETCEAVRLHVDAKRYLCAVDPSYFGQLSNASRQSLTIQGGPDAYARGP